MFDAQAAAEPSMPLVTRPDGGDMCEVNADLPRRSLQLKGVFFCWLAYCRARDRYENNIAAPLPRRSQRQEADTGPRGRIAKEVRHVLRAASHGPWTLGLQVARIVPDAVLQTTT